MASPQKENGYTSLSNELFDKLISINISGQELRAAMFVIRKTYGFNKKDDYISLSQFCKAMNIKKIRASQVVNSLQLRKILTVKENINGLTKMYRFNKDYEQWITVKEKRYRKGFTNDTVKVLRSSPLRKTLTTKDTLTKDTLTKERYVFSLELFENFWKKYPARNGKVVGKLECLKYLKSLKFIEWEPLLKAVDNYSQSEKIKEGYTRDPINFLKKDYWRDWLEAEQKERESKFDTPPSISHEEKKYWEHEDTTPEGMEKIHALIEGIGKGMTGIHNKT
ncbi:MAG: replication protein [Proteobacteria bacterium]|nr:replication protein [Pseudomonadota bacterium]